jgi:hypothetical protein
MKVICGLLIALLVIVCILGIHILKEPKPSGSQMNEAVAIFDGRTFTGRAGYWLTSD